LNAIVDDESDDYEKSESNSDDEHIERNVKVAHFELSWIALDNINEITDIVKSLFPLVTQNRDGNLG
jgi:hypothetical protein